MRWLLLLALCAAAPALAADPGRELRDQRTEYTRTYEVAPGVYAVSSEARPLHWWDGAHWRDPDPLWRGRTLRGLPGPLLYHASAAALVVTRRDGGAVAQLGWRGSPDGHVYRFTWDGLPCVLAAEGYGQKLACTVEQRRGAYTLTVPTDGAQATGDDGAAVLGGLFRLDRLVVIGADGIEYPDAVSAWRLDGGALSVAVDDSALPEAALPYVLDPLTGPNLPGTCANDATTGTTAWSTPTNAQTSDNARATASLTAGSNTQYLKCTNFGFTEAAMPDEKVVLGIVVEMEVSASNASAISVLDSRIVKPDGTIGTTSRVPLTNTTWTTSDAFRTVGGTYDLWGETWTASDITGAGSGDPDVGIAIRARNTSGSTRTARIDMVRMTVYFSPPNGRVYMTGWDTWFAEGGTETGTPAYNAAVVRTGVAGLSIATAANTAESWCTPSLDTDLTSRGYLGVYLSTDGGTPLAPGGQAVVAYLQQDSEPGCYLLLRRDGSGRYEYQVRYHGKESADIDFGTFEAPSLDGSNIILGQEIEGDRVACPLYLNGLLAQNFSQQMVGDCSGGACDLANACLGTPATSAVGDYVNFSALTLGYDDLRVDNVEAPGVGAVYALRPDAAGSVSTTWSSVGSCSTGSSGYDCLTDWASGEADGADASSCIGSGKTTRERGSSTGLDIWNIANLPTLATTDRVRGVRMVARACENNTNNASLRLNWRNAGVDATGPDTTVTQNTRVLMTELRTTTTISPQTADWTESEVNALQIGMDKYAAGGTPRVTALLAYVEVQSPSPQPDQNMQDTSGDGYLTVVTGCDSITAGTNNTACESVDGTNACTAACSTDGECDGGTCEGGQCQMLCEFNADCTCGTAAICPTLRNWVSQLSLAMPQIDNLINCGRNTMPLPWWQDVLPTILAKPYDLAPPCKLIRGAWGHCSTTTATACSIDSECPTAETCVHHEPDLVVSICGFNDSRAFGPSDCTVNLFAPTTVTDLWGVPSCPLAATSPGDYEATRTTCTVNADCTATFGANSVCLGHCEGHDDPVWPCWHDFHCGTCTATPTRGCSHQGSCPDGTASEGCDDDTDCSAGSCRPNATDEGPWGDAFGAGCADCEHRACLTSTKYCSVDCSDVPCSTDADCSATGGVGGVCNTGGGYCTACGNGAGYALSSAALHALVERRRATNPGDFRTDRVLDRQRAITTTLEAADVRHMPTTYMLSGQLNVDAAFQDGLAGQARGQLRSFEYVIDLHNLGRFSDDRYAGRFGTLVAADNIHNDTEGAALAADGVAASLGTLYPVCSGDSSDVCGYCDVSCSLASHCDQGGAGETCSGSRCKCATSADCAAGCACQDIDGGAGTDNRCVCEDIADCPAGDSVEQRKRIRDNDLCAAGTCTDERVPPLCTRQKVRCEDTSDCDGPGRGDVCAADGALLPCERNADCRDGGAYADDVCAGYPPVGVSTPTPLTRWCQQPTPTP